MTLTFDLLTASEIDCRIGTTKPPKGDQAGGVSLLLYKDARCDMTRLDKTVGCMNWQREHSRENANCTVSIWDDEKKQWVSKEDTGVASRTEAEKGIASDSFKRACVNWGIGRELYTAPFIWISGDPDKLKWERFRVKAIGYDENRCINALTIVDKKNKVVFQMGKVEDEEPDTPDEPSIKVSHKVEITQSKTVPTTPVSEYLMKSVAEMKKDIPNFNFGRMRNVLIDGGIVPDVASDVMTMEQAVQLVEAIYSNFKKEDA